MSSYFNCLPAAMVALSVFAMNVDAASAADTVQLSNCLITAFDEVLVPGREPGALMELDPETSREGTEVVKGTKLGQLDNLDAKAKEKSALNELKVATALSESKAEWEATVKTRAVAEAEYLGALEANKKNANAVSTNEVRRLKLTMERTDAEIAVKALEYKNNGFTKFVKEAQLDAAQNELARREIVAPLDGIVVERMKHVGEWVQPGDPILKIVRLDRLRVEGYVSANQFVPGDVADAQVKVVVRLPGGREEAVDGVIEFVNPVVEASGEYRVWTEIKNRKDAGGHWIFRPGTTAEMVISTGRKAAPARAAVTPRAAAGISKAE